MSFVSKGDKKLRNMARKAGPGGDRAMMKDSFGKKGDGHRKGAAHNMAMKSMDRTKEPVSEDVEDDVQQYDATPPVHESEYDPASGKRAKSIGDLREAYKKISEKASRSDGHSPTGSEGGQDAKHLSNSKNESGFMDSPGEGELSKMTKKKPRAQASQMVREDQDEDMVDPLDEEQEDNEQTMIGMTPNGSRRNLPKAMKMKKKYMVAKD
jgi:hypothetical protein